MYKCEGCGKHVELENQVRCPFCGYKILLKTRPERAKRVKSY